MNFERTSIVNSSLKCLNIIQTTFTHIIALCASVMNLHRCHRSLCAAPRVSRNCLDEFYQQIFCEAVLIIAESGKASTDTLLPLYTYFPSSLEPGSRKKEEKGGGASCAARDDWTCCCPISTTCLQSTPELLLLWNSYLHYFFCRTVLVPWFFFPICLIRVTLLCLSIHSRFYFS